MKSSKTTRRITFLREKDGICCSICRLQMLFNPESKHKKLRVTVDHILELCNGGSSERSNLRLAHRFCNNGRASHTPRYLRRKIYAYWRKHIGIPSMAYNALATVQKEEENML